MNAVARDQPETREINANSRSLLNTIDLISGSSIIDEPYGN